MKKLASFLVLASTFLAASSAQALIFGSRPRPPVFTPTPAPAPGSAKLECATVWVGFNMDNYGKVIRNGVTWNGLGSVLYATRTWHGGFPRGHYSGTDRAMSDIRSAKVNPGCTLYLSTDATFAKNGNPLSFDGGLGGRNVIGAGAFATQGRVGSLNCVCGGTDVSPVTYSSVMVP